MTDEPHEGGYLPGVGQTVTFHARPFERRQGRDRFPAFVLNNDENGGLGLLVFFDADDHVSLRGVPAFSHAAGFGWSIPDPGRGGAGTGELIRRIDDTLFGELEIPETPILGMIYALTERQDQLEAKVAKLLSAKLA